jgi:hypothetical protein
MEYNAPIDSYTSEQGCESSFADAKHDFHTIFKADNIEGYVRANIPQYTNLKCNSLSEDAFIDKYELTPGSDSNSNKADPEFIPNHLNASLQSRYTAKYIARPQHQYENAKSLLQEYFAEIGLIDDIFFICDVAYANVREDLKFANTTINPSQHFYWVQNAQTLYDPAGKTTWHSDKDYFEEEDEEFNEAGELIPKPKPKKGEKKQTIRIDCPNHFKKSDSKFLFCWQNAKKNIVTLYPEWSAAKFPNKEDSYNFSTNNPEQMLYVNKDLFLSIRSNVVNDYSTHEAYLIITNPSLQGYFGYADKILSAKGSGILSASELASYHAKGNELKTFVKFINDNTKNPNSDKTLFLDEVMNYSPEFQILAKKVGDASQSLSCCQKEINLQRFKDNVEGYKKSDNVEDFKSNGNHAFVSFDRIAIGCALNYNSPIVIGNTQRGFVVYIRNDLINIHKQFQKFFLNSSGSNYELLNTLKDSTTSSSAATIDNFILNAELYRKINSLKEEVKASITVACRNLNIIPVDDITYQNFLINHFIELNVFQLFSNLNSTILEFNETEYNNKIKKIYIDKLSEILTDTSLDITYNLDDINEITDITSIITNINNNINNILKKIEEKYNTIKTEEEIEKYDSTIDPTKHNIYLKIQKSLKLIEKIVIDINEIQKLFLSNIESMRKIIQHQNLINPPEQFINPHVLDTFKLKQLPKGIASNILTCTPYIYCQTNSKPIRNSDIFFERSTSIFGTTTVILQIFNIFNCTKLDKLKTKFVKIIYNTTNDLLQNADESYNTSFIGVISTVREQFNMLLMSEPEIDLNTYDINLVTSPAATDESAIAAAADEAAAASPADKAAIAASPADKAAIETADKALTSTDEAASPADKAAIAAIATSPAADEVATVIKATETAATIDPMKEFLKTKKLLIMKLPLQETIPFKQRIEKIRDATPHIEELFTSTASSSAGGGVIPDEDIQIAYENEVFIKGFIGLFAFMSYTKITGKKVPALFITKQGDNQSNILERLFQMLYLNLNDTTLDTTSIQEIQGMREYILRNLQGFSFEDYARSSDKKAYIKTRTRETRSIAEKGEELINNFSVNIEKYINYYAQMEAIFRADESLSTIDSATDTEVFKNKSDFTVYSFRKLLELNIITVGNKPLTNKFEGINANEINANMALLYFIENKIATMNKEPVPHPELIGLFQQLFAGSGLYSQEGGNKVGGGDGLFDTMYDLFVSNDDTLFKEYRKNSYLLLNMPTNYEISISNFQSYPSEIRIYFQNLNREFTLKKKREKEREEQIQKMKTMQFSGPGRNLGEGIIQPQRLASPVETFGGNTKKHIKKNKKTKRNLKTKNKTKKQKTKKIIKTRKLRNMLK